MQFNSLRAGGILYTVTDEVLVGAKQWPKKEIWIEVPTQKYSQDQSTDIWPFELFGDECAGTDWLEEGAWYDFVFRIQGKVWHPKGEPDNKKVFPKLKLIDIKKGPNPFSEGKDIKNKPEDLSNTIVSELADQVKDWANEDTQRDTLFDEDGNIRGQDKLPF